MKVGLLVLAACGLLVAGCGGSTVNVSEAVSAEVGAKADCWEAGLEEVAGEREQSYTCSYPQEHTFVHVCVAVADGDVYLVRPSDC